VLADSGSFYTAEPFDSAEAACEWWAANWREYHDRWKPMTVPKFEDGAWVDEIDSPNAFKADDLLAFWQRDAEEWRVLWKDYPETNLEIETHFVPD